MENANKQRDEREEGWRKAVLELQDRCKQLEENCRQDAATIAQLQEDLLSARNEGRQKRAEVE